MSHELYTLKASLTEAQRAELQRQVDLLPESPCRCCRIDLRERHESLILAALRAETQCDRYRDAARAVMEAP